MKKDGWHYPELGEYPEPVKLNEWESYNPIVLVFMYRYDDHSKARYRLDLMNSSEKPNS